MQWTMGEGISLYISFRWLVSWLVWCFALVPGLLQSSVCEVEDLVARSQEHRQAGQVGLRGHAPSIYRTIYFGMVSRCMGHEGGGGRVAMPIAQSAGNKQPPSTMFGTGNSYCGFFFSRVYLRMRSFFPCSPSRPMRITVFRIPFPPSLRLAFTKRLIPT